MKQVSKLQSSKSFSRKKDIILIVSFLLIVFILFFIYYFFIIGKQKQKNEFAEQSTLISDQNINPIFQIEKIMLFSSADAIDNSKNQDLKDLNICQYTDIAIYLNNTSTIKELTPENTITELYIDEIELETTSNKGIRNLNYKLPFNMGKFRQLTKPENNRIDFNILNNNSDYQTNSYAGPTFCTDCSIPITLGYTNQEIVEHYAFKEDSNSISFNGKILQQSNVSLEDLSCTLKFQIHIRNNQGESFVYHANIPLPLESEQDNIYSGYIMKVVDTPTNFLRVIS